MIVNQSRSLFEVYLDNLGKDLQQLQELEAYINAQHHTLLLTSDELGDTLNLWCIPQEKTCLPFLHCNPPSNIVYYVGYLVLLLCSTTDTFRRSNRIWLHHTLTLVNVCGTTKTPNSKGTTSSLGIWMIPIKMLSSNWHIQPFQIGSVIYTDTSLDNSDLVCKTSGQFHEKFSSPS